jgi:hypothetical protein
MASTNVTKPDVHAEGIANLVNPSCKLIVANDNIHAANEQQAIAA